MAFVDGENGENFMSEILGLSQFGKSDTRKQVKDLNKFGMNYEQRYKEALERMKSWVKGEHPDCFSEAQKAAEFIFPEIKESEDEKIRKSLIRFLKSPFVNENIADEKVDPWIAWLEKQVEQESVDKIEPKFKVGDWIVSNNDGEVWQIGSIYYVTGRCCYLYNKNIDSICVTKEELNNDYHLWTIQDAKDGDVLVCETDEVEWIFIYREIIPADSVVPHDLLRYYFLLEGNYLNCNGVSAMITDDYELYLKPATKEQRDLLFQKINEAGYKWDSEKKELKKIHDIDEGKAEMDYCFTKMMNGEKITPAWSEEDEKYIKDLFDYFTGGLSLKHAEEDIVDWLKSIKQRIGWKPSEEQMDALETAVSSLQSTALESLYNDLKKRYE